MKVAVTGAGGYVGGHLITALRQDGHEVIALARGPVTGVQTMKFDLAGKVSDIAAEALLHCAWDFRTRGLTDARQVNVAGARRLLDAAQRGGVSRLIFLSTMSAFAGCRSVYGKSKLEAEALFLDAGGLVLRPGLVWGSHPGGMVGTLDRLARLPIAPVIAGAGKLHLVHVDDLTAAIAAALALPRAPACVMTAAHAAPWDFSAILKVRARSAGHDPLCMPVPWPLVWLGLRLLESLSPASGLRSDSVIGAAFTDPSPHFTVLPGGILPRAFA